MKLALVVLLACVLAVSAVPAPLCLPGCPPCGSASGGASGTHTSGTSIGPGGVTNVESSSSQAGGAASGGGSTSSSASTNAHKTSNIFGQSSHVNTNAQSVQQGGGGFPCCC